MEKKKMQLPPDEHRCTQSSGLKRWRCKNFRMSYGNDDDSVHKSRHCEKHYNYFANRDQMRRKRKKDGEGATIHDTYEERCGQTGGGGWRCKNFRMGHGAAADDDTVPKTKFCEKHYNYYAEVYKKKKSSLNGDTIVDGGSAKIGAKRKDVERTQDSGELKSSTKPVVETRASKWRKNVMEGDGFVCEKSNQPAADHTCNSDIIVEGDSANNGRKRKYAEIMSGELESLAGTMEAVPELESLEHYKSKCFELSVELEKKKVELKKEELEIENIKVELEKTKLKLEERELELEKIKVEKKVELQEKKLELEKMKLECTELQGRLAEVEETRKGATEYWRNKCSDLESLVLRLELENSTVRCEASRVSNLERNGNESPILRREVELSNSDKIESEIQVLQNESGEEPRDKINKSKLNAETGTGGSKESRVYELKTKENELILESGFHKCSVVSIPSGNVDLLCGGDNVEEREDLGCLEMSKTFGNLISDSGDRGDSLGEPEDCNGLVDLRTSLGDPMDTLAMETLNRSKDELEWKSEPELLSSFEEDPELCMRAVCALNRQEISEEEISAGLYYQSDILRWTTLAKLIMGEDCKGDVMKSLKELETVDPKAVGDCKKLARRYSMHLFDIYLKGKDPFFHPAKAASHGWRSLLSDRLLRMWP